MSSTPGKPELTHESPSKSPKRSIWPSKRQKLSSDDTPKKEKDVEVENLIDLTVGNHYSKTLKFRVTFVDRDNEFGTFCFRGLDQSGEVLFKAFSGDKKLVMDLKFNEVYKIRGFKVVEPYFQDATGKFEILVASFSKLVKVDDPDFPVISFESVALDKIQDFEPAKLIDTFGVVTLVDETDGSKKQITISDQTKEEVLVNFYSKDKLIQCRKDDVLYLRAAIKGNTSKNQEVLNVKRFTLVLVNPDCEKAVEVKEKYHSALAAEREEYGDLDEDQSL